MWVCMNRSGRGGTGPGRQRAPAGRPRAGAAAAGEADYSYSTVPVSMLRYIGKGLFWNVGSKLCTMPLAAWDT